MNSTICSLLCVFAPECARNSEVNSCEEILERNILQKWEKDLIQNEIYTSQDLLCDCDHFIETCNFPGITRHEVSKIYEPSILSSKCAKNCTTSFSYTSSAVETFHKSLNFAAVWLMAIASVSFSISIASSSISFRKQLKECSLALNFVLFQLGVLLHIMSKNNFHCQDERLSFLCPLSAFLFTFSLLSFSALYFAFTSNIKNELKLFLETLSLHPREFEKIQHRYSHIIGGVFALIVAASLSYLTPATPKLSFKDNSTTLNDDLGFYPDPIMKICMFSSPWRIYLSTTTHILMSALSVAYTISSILKLIDLLNLSKHLSVQGRWRIRMYLLRLSSLLFCLSFHTGACFYALYSYSSMERTSEHVEDQCFRNNVLYPENPMDCPLKNDVSSLVYVIYSLEFCVFIQGLWPLDASTVGWFLSFFMDPEKEEDEIEQFSEYIPLVYRNRGQQGEYSSMILKNPKKISGDSHSSIENYLRSNRLIERRPAAIPDTIPDLKRSQTPEIRKRKVLRKRNNAWSIKEGFSPQHQRMIARESSDSESEASPKKMFVNLSMIKQGHLSAMLAKVDDMKLSTTQSEYSDHNSTCQSLQVPFSSRRLDQIRLSDLTTDSSDSY